MEVYTFKKELVILADEPFSSGGEGVVIKVLSGPIRFQDVCAKIYYPKVRTSQKENKIKYMVQNPPSKVSGSGFLIGWPLEVLNNDLGEFLGFLMPLAAEGSKKLVNLTTNKISKKLDLSWHQRYERSLGPYSLLNRLKLINNIIIPIHLLHETGKYVLKDFKPDNVMVTATGVVSIVDMDSVQISENGHLLFPGEAATLEYIPPEFHTNHIGVDKTIPLEQSWDLFAIGVVFYQLLFGLHPFVVTPQEPRHKDSNNISDCIADGLFPFGPNKIKVKSYPQLHDKFTVLPPELQDLFVKTLSGAPSSRCTAALWGQTMHNLIVKAGNIPPPLPSSPGTTTATPPPSSPSPLPLLPTEEDLSKWNWGAFSFGWLWGVFNGVYWSLWQLVLAFVPYIGWIIVLITAFVLGAKGTRASWVGKQWSSYERFKKVQHYWANCGITWFTMLLSLLFCVLLLYFFS